MDDFIQTVQMVDDILSIDNIFVNFYQLAPLTGTRVTKELSRYMAFDEAEVSGLVYPPQMLPLDEDEKSIIREAPEIFSAYYHENTKAFKVKHDTIKSFIGD